MRRSGFDRSRTARASDLPWHTRSTPARRRRHLHFWFSDLWNLARDLYGRVDWGDGDSGVVFASHAVANPFWNGGGGVLRGRRRIYYVIGRHALSSAPL